MKFGALSRLGSLHLHVVSCSYLLNSSEGRCLLHNVHKGAGNGDSWKPNTGLLLNAEGPST